MGAYNDDVLFVHIPKTAGASVKCYMVEHLPAMMLGNLKQGKLPIGHIRLTDIERFTGRAPSEFKLIVTVVRDPYEQQLSELTYRARNFLARDSHELCVLAWQGYVRRYYAKYDINRCAIEGRPFVFRPEHLDIHGFMLDIRADFRAWYTDRVLGRIVSSQTDIVKEYGDYYRWWLDVDGEIPENVQMITVESLSHQLPYVLQPYADHELPPMTTRVNASPRSVATRDFYCPAAARLVEARFPWTFDKLYTKWSDSEHAPQKEETGEDTESGDRRQGPKLAEACPV